MPVATDSTVAAQPLISPNFARMSKKAEAKLEKMKQTAEADPDPANKEKMDRAIAKNEARLEAAKGPLPQRRRSPLQTCHPLPVRRLRGEFIHAHTSDLLSMPGTTAPSR